MGMIEMLGSLKEVECLLNQTCKCSSFALLLATPLGSKGGYCLKLLTFLISPQLQDRAHILWNHVCCCRYKTISFKA